MRWMTIAISSALLATGVAVAQRAVPVTPIPAPVLKPVLPNINPTPLTPNLTPTPAPNLQPSPVIAPSPVVAPHDPCTGLSAPSYCTDKSLPESGGDDSSFSDLCEATPRPAWCEDPAKPKLTVDN